MHAGEGGETAAVLPVAVRPPGRLDHRLGIGGRSKGAVGAGPHTRRRPAHRCAHQSRHRPVWCRPRSGHDGMCEHEHTNALPRHHLDAHSIGAHARWHQVSDGNVLAGPRTRRQAPAVGNPPADVPAAVSDRHL